VARSADLRVHNEKGKRLVVAGGLTATQAWYTEGMRSVTSSFRMSSDLAQELANAATRSGKGKNAIIVEALRRYLDEIDRGTLAAEARRQSLLVSGAGPEMEWYDLADVSGWR